MLPRKNRLKRPKDIQQVFKFGKSARSGFLFLRFLKNNSKNTRIAVGVGVKYSKSAVRRNRLRRRIKSAVAILFGRVKPGYDVFIGILPNQIGDAPTANEIHSHLKKCFELIG